jgi:hypothetical protein
MRTLKTIGCFIGKWTWNGFIGIIFLALAIACVIVKVPGQFGAKIIALLGMCISGLSFMFMLITFFYDTKVCMDLILTGLIIAFGPAFAVGIVGEILERLTIAVRDNCFID